jgi:hypothetical protein
MANPVPDGIFDVKLAYLRLLAPVRFNLESAAFLVRFPVIRTHAPAKCYLLKAALNLQALQRGQDAQTACDVPAPHLHRTSARPGTGERKQTKHPLFS